jgi:hypothetical protein
MSDRHSGPAPISHLSHPPHNTALKWRHDGELSRLDLERILALLTQADPVAEALMSPSPNPEN